MIRGLTFSHPQHSHNLTTSRRHNPTTLQPHIFITPTNSHLHNLPSTIPCSMQRLFRYLAEESEINKSEIRRHLLFTQNENMTRPGTPRYKPSVESDLAHRRHAPLLLERRSPLKPLTTSRPIPNYPRSLPLSLSTRRWRAGPPARSSARCRP